jgi:hypothetical protein
MKTSVKLALATSAVAVVGGLFMAGSTIAASGFGHGGRMGMMFGPAQEMLKGVDSNSDAALSQDEINAAVNARYTTFDGNKDGQLSLEEFQALWADLTRPIAVRAFQFLDPMATHRLRERRSTSASVRWCHGSTATTTGRSRRRTGPEGAAVMAARPRRR